MAEASNHTQNLSSHSTPSSFPSLLLPTSKSPYNSSKPKLLEMAKLIIYTYVRNEVDMPLSTSLQYLYSNKCLIRVWFVAISTYCSSRVSFSTNNVLHLQVMVIFLKQQFLFLSGLPVFSTEFVLQSCFCNHSCIQKFLFCKKDLLQQSNNQSFDTLYYCLEYEHVRSSKGKVKCKTFETTPVPNIFNSNRETRR